jgi:hypothetical protein
MSRALVGPVESENLAVLRRPALETEPPLLKFNAAHVERVIGDSCEPSGDTPALLLVVNRQVDDLATRTDSASDPAER